ncbi:MAG: gamma-glutamyltransferase family protein [Alphaproteobacteria bacterium GM202ARS2]|nr:gamma-glutamyltransferase family protein [Alphaproteobacteria bacterium GM202ARS2]
MLAKRQLRCWVLNVVEPQSSGLGGSGFMLYADAETNDIIAYEGRETAPQAMPKDAFVDGGKPLGFMDASSSGMAVGVPGLLAMLARAHRQHGTMPWAQTFEPAISLAEAGFVVSPRMAMSIARHPFLFEQDPHGGFYDKEGTPLSAGTIYKNEALAETFRRIAKQGSDVFYRGALADDIVTRVRSSPRTLPGGMGALTQQDLADYRAGARPPLCAPYRVWRVCGVPLPSSGGIALLQILQLLEPFPLASMDETARMHVLAEAMRLAYRDRAAFLGDDAFSLVPVARLLSPDYLDRRRQLLRADKALDTVQAGSPEGEDTEQDGQEVERESTTHLSIIDRYGNAVALTSSIGPSFGSGLRVGGFYLNGELTDFAFVDGGDKTTNSIEGGKRPLSSMSPTIVFDSEGRVRLVLGSAGGVHIIAYVARVLMEVLDGGKAIQEALSARHYVKKGQGRTLLLEEHHKGRQGQDSALVRELRRKNHGIESKKMTSGLQAIYVDDRGVLWGGVDPRREGLAVGQ